MAFEVRGGRVRIAGARRKSWMLTFVLLAVLIRGWKNASAVSLPSADYDTVRGRHGVA